MMRTTSTIGGLSIPTSFPTGLARRLFLDRQRSRPRVSVEPIGETYAGHRLLLRLRIDAPVDIVVRDLRVRLRRAMCVYGFSGGDFGYVPSVKRVILAEETFTRIGRLSAGSAHEEISWLRIAEPLPTLLARRISVGYRLKVRVRLEDGRTLRCSPPVRVLSSRSLHQRVERLVVRSEGLSPSVLTLKMDLHGRPGQRLQGVARVTPPGDGIRGPVVMELRRREEASRADHTDRAFVREWKLERAVLAEGVPGPFTVELPLEVTVPLRGPCTLHTDHTAVRWLLYVVLPGMGRNVCAGWEINVHTGA